jgi:ATP-dependent Clp protease ATP-binding subunit ClpC
LRGAFEGKNTIVVDVFKDAEGKIIRLDFKGESREIVAPTETIAAGSAH